VRAVASVAVNVFRESVRDKVLYNLVLFALLLISASYLIGQLTAGQDLKIIKDLGLAASAIFGLFIAVFIGVGLVYKEVERRSIYNLLVKPLKRYQFILGKFCGLSLTLFVNLAVMAVALYAVLAYMAYTTEPPVRAAWEAPALDPALLKVFLLTFVELVLLTAIALFFSSFSSPILAAALTFGLYIIGHFNADLQHFDRIVSSKSAGYLARGIYYLLPNLAPFDIKSAVVHGLPVSAGYITMTVGYACAYSAALLVATILIFSRRDFR
jgi:ABC-type transport system involved in multi-copper enzyme maturation permease subunit